MKWCVSITASSRADFCSNLILTFLKNISVLCLITRECHPYHLIIVLSSLIAVKMEKL